MSALYDTRGTKGDIITSKASNQVPMFYCPNTQRFTEPTEEEKGEDDRQI